MKHLSLFIILIIFSTTLIAQTLEEREEEFEEVATTYQELYMDGSENCDEIIGMMDKELTFSENGIPRSYEQLKQYCPYLLDKNVIDTYIRHRLLNDSLGYAFFSHLWITDKGDTARESGSILWRKRDGNWKIIECNNLLYYAAAELGK